MVLPFYVDYPSDESYENHLSQTHHQWYPLESLDLDNNSETSRMANRDETLAKVEIATLSFILFLAVAGNGLILFALVKRLLLRSMSRIYFFMMHLSLADLFVAFGNILPQLAWDITYRFRGPDFLCRAVKFLQVFVLYLSTYILAFMALDRYFVICRQSDSSSYYYKRNNGPKILVALAYLLAILLALPQAFIFSMKEVGADEMDCWVTFIEPWGARTYVTWFVSTAFITPLLIIVGSYGAICWKVVNFTLPVQLNQAASAVFHTEMNHIILNSASGEQSLAKGSDTTVTIMDTNESERPSSSSHKASIKLKRQLSRAKIKTLKLTLVVVVCFFICWSPFCITQLVMVYGPIEEGTNPGPMKVIFLLLASLNSCTNPWIYLAFSESLMNQIRVWLRLGLRRSENNYSIGDEQGAPG